MDGDSTGQLEMRALSRRLKDYAADQSEPTKQFDLRMAAELMEHLARLDYQTCAAGGVETGLGAAAIARPPS
jgi:hypothetical protein